MPKATELVVKPPTPKSAKLSGQTLVTGENELSPQLPKGKIKPALINWRSILAGVFRHRTKKTDSQTAATAQPPILDINLIPVELAKHPEIEFPKKLFQSGLILALVILLVIGSYLGITWYQFRITKQIQKLENQIADLDQQIKGLEADKSAVLTLQNRLKLVRQLLDNHVYWTKFFALLEKYTISEVYYTNFSMTGREQLVISAKGRDYQSVAKQLMAFQQASDFVKNVRIDSAAAEIDSADGTYLGVNFNINLEFLPGVFLRPSQ
jgi:type II secretory pathway pseudopilin PulG